MPMKFQTVHEICILCIEVSFLICTYLVLGIKLLNCCLLFGLLKVMMFNWSWKTIQFMQMLSIFDSRMS